MNNRNYFTTGCALAALALLFVLYVTTHQPKIAGSALGNCDVTTTTVNIGHQLATTVLVAGSYQWVSIVQPINATNTVSVTLGGTAVAGQGFQLTPATTTSPVPSLTVGFAVDRPYRGLISAKTNTGSTTVNVISCK